MIRRLALAAALLAATLAAAPASAASWLDPAFGGGVVTGSTRSAISGHVVDAARTPDGGVVLAVEPAHIVWGCCDAPVGHWTLVRLRADGTPAPGFGSGGVLPPASSAPLGSTASIGPAGVALDSAGRIVLGGTFQHDTGFDGYRAVVLRRLADGSPDRSFGGDGRVDVTLTGAALCTADRSTAVNAVATVGTRILVAGTCGIHGIYVARLTATGALDASFGTRGIATFDQPDAGVLGGLSRLLLLPDGRIVLVARSHPVDVVRLTAAGRRDATYGGGDGRATLPASLRSGALAVAAADGSLIIDDGDAKTLRRVGAAGTLAAATYAEPHFPAGCGYPQITDVAGTPGHLVVALFCLEGTTLVAFADGTADAGFGSRTATVTATDAGDIAEPGTLLLADGGRTLVAGSATALGLRVERRLASGALDPAWAGDGTADVSFSGRLFGLQDSTGVEDSAGRLLTATLVGERGMADEGAILVQRRRANGTLDPTFGSGGSRVLEGGGWRPGRTSDGGEHLGDPHVVALGDGSVAVLASWTSQERYPPGPLEAGIEQWRLTSTGALDGTFGNGGRRLVTLPGFQADYGSVGTPVRVAGDGLLLPLKLGDGAHGGDPAVIRLRADGSLDPAFGGGGVRRAPVPAGYVDGTLLAARASDGVLVGMVAEVQVPSGLARRIAIAHVRADGTIDGAFGGGGRLVVGVADTASNLSLATTASGRLLVAWFIRRHPYDHYDASADVTVRRYTAAGAVDATFGSAGRTVFRSTARGNADADILRGLAADGERPLLLLERWRSNRRAQGLVRLTAKGAPDPTWGGSGGVTYPGAVNGAIGTILARADHGVVLVGRQKRGGAPLFYETLAARFLPAIVTATAPAPVVLTRTATFRWRVSDGRSTRFDVSARVAGATAAGFGRRLGLFHATTRRAVVRTLAAGTTTCLRALAPGLPRSAAACATAPVPATALARSGGWRLTRSTALYRGAGLTSDGYSSSLRATLVAQQVVLVATRCRSCGEVEILWNGRFLGTVSLRGAPRHGVAISVARFARATRGTLELLANGAPVTIEGVAAVRSDAP